MKVEVWGIFFKENVPQVVKEVHFECHMEVTNHCHMMHCANLHKVKNVGNGGRVIPDNAKVLDGAQLGGDIVANASSLEVKRGFDIVNVSE
jgi:hypothetical protein